MGSENTVTSSIPIPKWMKSKLNDQYNLDDSAFSPPSEDDGFFHIPYSKHNKSTSDFLSIKEEENQTKFISITKALNLNSVESHNSKFSGNEVLKHTLPCQKYLGGMCDPGVQGVNKSYGTDDGFKGEASQCGKSIVAVAEQMVRSNQLYNGRASDDTFNFSIGNPDASYLSRRRNSRSLPASPLSRRKNPFFTTPLLAQVDIEVSPAEHYVAPSGTYIAPAAARAAAKLRDVSPGSGGLRAKPSELREINCWSPTSM